MGQKVKHTPGPWELRNQIDSKGRFLVRGEHPDFPGDPTSSICIASGIRAMNATLIQAAPDLLAALKEADCPVWVHNAAITNDIEALRAIALWYMTWNNDVRMAAIAKAEGGAS